MPAHTPHLDLYLPGGGSLGIGGDDEAADIDKLNQNFQAIDAWALASDSNFTALNSFQTAQETRNQQYRGLAADLATLTGMRRGDTYRETDGTTFRLWEYDGTNWVTAEQGMYLIRPSTVGNGAVDASGAIIPTTGVNGNSLPLQVNNVFSSRFKTYIIKFRYRTSASVGSSLRLRGAGADHSGANYSFEQLHASSASVTASQGTAQTQFPVAATSAVFQFGVLEISEPSSNTQTKTIIGYGLSGSSLSNASVVGYLGNAPGDAFVADGFTFTLSAAANWADVSWFKVYGLA